MIQWWTRRDQFLTSFKWELGMQERAYDVLLPQRSQGLGWENLYTVYYVENFDTFNKCCLVSLFFYIS